MAAAGLRRGRPLPGGRGPRGPSQPDPPPDDPGLEDELVSALTIGETYFFRERAQFDFVGEVLTRLASRGGGDRLRVWSAGCASGEEAYTVSIVASQAGVGGITDVVGTDVSTEAVRAAEAARYREWSMRALSPEERARWFEQDGGLFRLHDRYRARVRFATSNLLDGSPGGRFDVTLCRNVLVYLTDEAIRRVATVLRDSLTDDGWLITASSDPPLEIDGLVAVPVGSGIAYRRTGVLSADDPSGAAGLTGAGRFVPGEVRGAFAGDWTGAGALRQRRGHSASTPGVGTAKAAPGTEAVDPNAWLDEAVDPQVRFDAEAVDAGASDTEAVDAGASDAEAVDAGALDADARFLAAVREADAGRTQEAVRSASVAVYLDPSLVAAYMLLGQLELAHGRRDASSRAFRRAARVLSSMPPQEPVRFLDGETAGTLLASARRLGVDFPGGAGSVR